MSLTTKVIWTKDLQKGLNAYLLQRMDLIIWEMFRKVVRDLEKEFSYSDQERKNNKAINMKVNGSKTCLMVREQNILLMGILLMVDL